ncbi:mini-chromosome maintenance complex-binding protein isoform X2 [Panulirus ornatus]|uniref:mini-chromosome maintenance complex-binding protein isoform X2 n=1 Tax=Panulirus ornatus TaxID=150431 RepID=UPI003A842E13
MPGVEDWTLSPHKVVNRIFEDCGSSGQWRQRAREFFEEELKQPSILEELPWVNETPLHYMRPNQVVRFRGMVQDMFDNEFFMDTYEVCNKNTGATRLQPGRYKDIAECGKDETIITSSPHCETGDRLVYYCVPIPGENEWVKKVYQDKNPHVGEASSSHDTSQKKRCIAEEDSSYTTGNVCDNQTVEEMVSMESESMGECGETKRSKTDGGDEITQEYQGTGNDGTRAVASLTVNLNFPIPEMKGTPCLLKIYDDLNFSLNEIIEVVGILSVDPTLSSRGIDHEEGDSLAMDLEEEAAHNLPPSLVPRLHVLTAQKVSHTNPLLPTDLSCSKELSVIQNMRETREMLCQVLQEAFLGDALAAELMICHLVSSVYLRKDVIALGKYSMNISGVSKSLQEQQYTFLLYKLISSLVTQSHFFSMTLSNMNTTNFIPKKDYQANRLISGLLQLSQHTHLVLDETALTAGQLDTKGVQNLTALGNIINWQKADYEFQYHQIEQQTNIPVLILSEGRAMISSDAEVRLDPKHSDVPAAFRNIRSKLTPDMQQRIRLYLTIARLIDYNLSDEMQKMVQDDFVHSRRDKNGITANDLHKLLVLARLVAVSCGETSLTCDVWKSAKVLENERNLRLNIGPH